MGLYTYLKTPQGEFEKKGAYPLGWFLLYKAEDFKIEFGIPEEAPDEGEQLLFVGFITTVKDAKRNYQERKNAVKSKYMKTLLTNMKELENVLSSSPDTGVMRFDFGDYSDGADEDSEAFKEEVMEILADMDRAVRSDRNEDLKKVLGGPFGSYNFTGNIEKDMSDYKKINERDVSVFLIGQKND